MEIPSIYLNRILSETAKRSASRLHLTVGSPPLVRIDGQFKQLEGEEMLSSETINKIMESFLSEEQKLLLKNGKEITLVKIFGGSFRFRINIYFQKELPAISFHYISNTIKSISELGLPEPLSSILSFRAGLFIIAGSFSSGKTTTAAAIIEEINKNSKKYMITLENPIEYIFISKNSVVEQRQIGSDVNDIIAGVEHCLDQDLDVVYIGEIKKDFEKAMPQILDLAAGNSLVFLEINADSTVRVIEKILDALKHQISIESARYYLADVLKGIFVQRLLPKRGGGLIVVPELTYVNPAIRSLIRDGKIYQLESIIQTSRKEGMISMSKSIEELIMAGEIKQEDL